jgi:hypothetical protein
MKNNLLGMAAAALAGASALALAAQAAETEYKFTACGHVKSALLTAGPDLTTYTFEAWFTPTPDNPVKALQGATYKCVGYTRVMKGEANGTGSCLWTDTGGDTVVGEFKEVPGTAPTWTFLSGTGKWKGISGDGTYKELSMSKPAADGTVEVCLEETGKWMLP